MNYFNYFSEIEATFIRRRGRNLLLSPLDWALIETWQERGVPLPVVLRGIERVFDAFDKSPNKRRTIKSLTYCREEIEAQYAEWLESQIGKNGRTQVDAPSDQLFSDEDISAHLIKVVGELKNARDKTAGELQKTLEKVLNRLAEVKEEHQNAEKLEAIFEKLDDSIDEILLKSNSDQTLKDKIANQIDSYKDKMAKDAYQKTFDLMLIKTLREEMQIPRLSLFYL